MCQNCGVAFSWNVNRGVWGGSWALLCMHCCLKCLKLSLELRLAECREGQRAGHGTESTRLIYIFLLDFSISNHPALNCCWLWPLRQFPSTEADHLLQADSGIWGCWRNLLEGYFSSQNDCGCVMEWTVRDDACDADLCFPNPEFWDEITAEDSHKHRTLNY